MTKGILMFAINGEAKDTKYNTVKIDYITMATANAKNIKKYMHNNNVALITDQKGKKYIEDNDYIVYFDNIIIIDSIDTGSGPNTNAKINNWFTLENLYQRDFWTFSRTPTWISCRNCYGYGFHR